MFADFQTTPPDPFGGDPFGRETLLHYAVIAATPNQAESFAETLDNGQSPVAIPGIHPCLPVKAVIQALDPHLHDADNDHWFRTLDALFVVCHGHERDIQALKTALAEAKTRYEEHRAFEDCVGLLLLPQNLELSRKVEIQLELGLPKFELCDFHDSPFIKSFEVNNANLLRSIGDGIKVGSAFVFIPQDIYQSPELNKMLTSLGVAVPEEHHIRSLVTASDGTVPAVSILSKDLSSLTLTSLTCDKMVYREQQEDVHLLMLDLGSPNVEAKIILTRNGEQYSQVPFLTDHRGVFALTLRDLPGGSYSATLSTDTDTKVEFQVAEYALAPLTCQLLSRQLEGQRLSFSLSLESFGVPLNETVSVSLRERGEILNKGDFEAQQGRLQGTLQLTGDGPHDLFVQVLADPGKTAVSPLRGSRRSERRLTLISSLGYERHMSLFPGEDSEEVRGLHIREGALKNTPVRLTEVCAEQAEIKIMSRDIELLSFVIWDLVTGYRTERQLTQPKPGDTVELPIPGPMAIVLVGAFIGNRPWEGWATVIRPSASPLKLDWPSHAEPGQNVPLTIHAGQKDSPATVYLVVKDDRLLTQDTPETQLAAKLKSGLEDSSSSLHVGNVDAGLGETLIAAEPRSILKDMARLQKRKHCSLGPSLASGHINPFFEAKPEPPTLRPSRNYRTFDNDPFGGSLGGPPPGMAPGGAMFRSQVPGSAPRGAPADPFGLGSGLGDSDPFSVKSASDPFGAPPSPSLSGAFPAPPPGAGGMAEPVGLRGSDEFQSYESEEFEYLSSPDLDSGMVPTNLLEGSGEDSDDVVYSDDEEFSDSAVGYRREIPNLEDSSDVEDEPVGLDQPKQAPRKAAPDKPKKRPESENPPEVLLAQAFEVAGSRQVDVQLGPQMTRYIAEAFSISDLDWSRQEARLQCKADPYAELVVPPFAFDYDAVLGRLNVGSDVAEMFVTIKRDGEDVKAMLGDRPLPPAVAIPKGHHDILFLAGPGLYEVEVRCAETNKVARSRRRINAPGKIKDFVRSTQFVSADQALSVDDELLAITVLPGLNKTFKGLVKATESYAHKCCEQTAAKMLCSISAYILADNTQDQLAAENSILAGVRREQSMWIQGQGFRMYPESRGVDTYWGKEATVHLFEFELLQHLPETSVALKQAVKLALEMARDTAKAYGISALPSKIERPRDAYRVVRSSQASATVKEQAVSFAKKRFEAALVDQSPAPVFPGRVGLRVQLCYTLATLAHSGLNSSKQVKELVNLANSVFEDLQPGGRLYSTVDSVALVALVKELRSAGFMAGGSQDEQTLRVNGEAMTVSQGVNFKGVIKNLEVLKGLTTVETLKLKTESWELFESNVEVSAGLSQNGEVRRKFKVGAAIDLVVKLEQGYQSGDVLHVCLPAALSRVYGGAQVKKFSMDFAGQSELRIPLAATGITVGRNGKLSAQSFAICVRNMYEEERVGNPGLMEVLIRPSQEGIDAAAMAGLKGFIG